MQPGKSGDESRMFSSTLCMQIISAVEDGYSNIECETHGIVFAIKHLHQYVYGQQFTVITNHKPLVSLAEKPIHRLPAQLQRLFLTKIRILYKIVYKPGKQMLISDCLSRLIGTERKSEKPLVRDSHILLCKLHPSKQVAVTNFSRKQQQDS